MQFPEPVPYRSADARISGWKTRIPGHRPLATPAVVGGRIFLGGGFGSHEFYALDADTGRLAWWYHTKDDGPTAAVVLDELVAFNTESCELEVLTTAGVPVWKKWLGDPLMSMPALGGGRVFQAFPNSQGDRQHYLACFDLRTGHEHWRQPLAGEIITAPVLADDNVYLATLEGSLYCFRQADGQPLWREAKNATSSPVVWNHECYFSRREEVTLNQAARGMAYQTEKMARRGATAADSQDYNASTERADWLDYKVRKTHSKMEALYEQHDGAVGFTFAKGDSKMEQAHGNLGHGTVAGLWAYQGSKPFAAHGRLYAALGAVLQCLEPVSEAVLWKRPLPADGLDTDAVLDSVLTPPALVNGKIFLGTTYGQVLCLAAHSGDVLWCADLGEPVIFQPAVADGRVYASTQRGSLFCLETGDPADDGWRMWGGGPAHNGLQTPADSAVPVMV